MIFIKVTTKLRDSLVPPDTTHEIPNVPMNQHTVFFSTTNEAEILQIILEIKNKVGGCNGIYAHVLKLAAPYIAPVFVHIINNVMLSGIRPNHFKQPEISPVHKTGSKIQLNNYRPRIYNFSINHNLISDKQFGCMKKKEANDAIVMLSKYIYDNLKSSKPNLISFLDYYLTLNIVPIIVSESIQYKISICLSTIVQMDNSLQQCTKLALLH